MVLFGVVDQKSALRDIPWDMLMLFVGALDWIGLVLGCIVIVVLLATTKPIVGKGYLYPLCPLDKKALLALLVRKPISRDNT